MIPVENIKIVGRNIDVTSEIKSYIYEKLDKLSRYKQKILSIEIIIEKEKFVYSINVLIHTYNKRIIKISTNDKSLLSGLDTIINKLKDIMVKYKEKKISYKKHSKEVLKNLLNTTQVYIKDKMVVQKMSEQEVINMLLKERNDMEQILFFNTDTNKVSLARKNGSNVEILDIDVI